MTANPDLFVEEEDSQPVRRVQCSDRRRRIHCLNSDTFLSAAIQKPGSATKRWEGEGGGDRGAVSQRYPTPVPTQRSCRPALQTPAFHLFYFTPRRQPRSSSFLLLLLSRCSLLFDQHPKTQTHHPPACLHLSDSFSVFSGVTL